MIENLDKQIHIKGPRKAAILMVVLGDQTGGEIMRTMDEEEVELVGREVARLGTISGEEAETVLEEFYQMTVAQDYVLKGGLEYARKMLMNAFGPEQSRKMLDRLMKALGNDTANFDVLQKADPQQLAKFIHSEHPQTIALVLSHLNPSQAAGLLFSLPPNCGPMWRCAWPTSIRSHRRSSPRSPASSGRNSKPSVS